MDSTYIVNSTATIIYGFVFGMSLMWWIDYSLKKEPHMTLKNRSEIKKEIRDLKTRIHMLKNKLIILENHNK